MFDILNITLLFLHFSLSFCAPVPPTKDFESRDALPILTLPYAAYRASSYNPLTDIYTFKNIRFAAPPVGELRWAKPAPPLKESTLQDGSYGPKCVQSAIKGLNLVGAGNTAPIGAAINQFLGGIPVPLFSGGDEDCLFLDVYVPGKALKNPSLKLPVAVWIFGGGYVFGSKDSLQPELPFYDGSGMIAQSSGNMIFVAINYRLGAYGFLAGTTMEKEGLPNAGLWDQRAALEWVQKYIGLVGGDPTKVTAMGESAGAGSIMHHLVAQGGKLNPLFSKAILQSPAFQWMWDRAGTVENTFQIFTALAGCKGQGLACLRKADAATLVEANSALASSAPAGSFAVGPTPDGSFIRQLPVLELATGNFWRTESLITSHCSDETSLFVSGLVQTDAQFTSFVNSIFPNYTLAAGINDLITKFYPPVSAKSTFSNQADRVKAFLRDSSFTCNVRHLTEAVGDAKVWNLQYSVTPGSHGTDLVPTFYNPQFTPSSFLSALASLLVPAIGPLIAGLSIAMQSYFTSYIITGDPNTSRKIFNLPPTVQWNHPGSKGESISGVVNIGNWGFSTVNDDQNQKTPCDFWRNIGAAATALGGYAAPGSVLSQTLVNVTGDPSRSFTGGNPY